MGDRPFLYSKNLMEERRMKMIDIKLIRENPELVKENIKKKFQDHKLVLVDEVVALDKELRAAKLEADTLRGKRNSVSKSIGMLMGQKKIEEANEAKKEVVEINDRLAFLEKEEERLAAEVKQRMMVIPNIIDDSVPIGKDDSENVELQKFGEPVVPEFDIPYHAEVMEKFMGLDKDSAGRTSGNGFYYLMGNIARLSTAMISYARDYMIDKNFIYCIPPFMIRSDVVTGVMSFAEMDAMMYKIEGEDLFLIGTSEHSMIGKFKDQMIKKEELPITMTSYSPCFRKEVGAHGIEERGIYRVHQFEKQEMIVICEPEESMEWYEKMWRYTVEIFRNLNIPVRQLECCSGDLADLKVKSCDIEAWSPRQQKYFEVGSCSNLGEAQARRLGIRIKGEEGNYFAHTLNNTVLASTRALIAFIENNINEDGSVNIPECLRPYMGGLKVIK
jgi:seryl-tRNA synthetase